MFKPILDLLAQHYSGRRAVRHVEELSRLHRIPASPGLRAAAAYCYDALRSRQLRAEILRFPADGKTTYWSTRMPLEWRCRSARLRLVSPGGAAPLLADIAADAMSVVQRSGPTPPEGIRADIATLDDALDPGLWPDVRGKLVLGRAPARFLYEEAVQKRGALGLLFDGAPPPAGGAEPLLDAPDAYGAVSFDWAAAETPCFGFVLTPRQGYELRRLARTHAVRLWAQVDSSLSDGLLDMASAALPGESAQEILALAPLDGPQPSAGRAGGAAVLLETAQVLSDLVAAGTLPRPRRTIRFLLAPQAYGLPAYLAEDERRRQRVLAAINLHSLGGSDLLLEGLPDAQPAPVDALAQAIAEAMAAQSGLGSGGTLSHFHQTAAPFSGAGDEAILCDPLTGIPCPAVRGLPGRYADSSADSVDKIDPESVRQAGLLAATYLYFLANAGPEEAVWLAYEAQTRYKARLGRLAQETCTEIRLIPAQNVEGDRAATATRFSSRLEGLRRKLLHESDRQQAALSWLEQLGDADLRRPLAILQSEAATAAWNEYTAAGDVIGGLAARAGLGALPAAHAGTQDQWEQEAAGMVPRRRHPGPVRLAGHLPRLSPERRAAWQAVEAAHSVTPAVLLDLALFWADGKRSLLEIIDLVELETGQRDGAYLVEYLRLLKELDLLTEQ